jgi:RNA polymerase sigma factor (sigma-70 family)
MENPRAAEDRVMTTSAGHLLEQLHLLAGWPALRAASDPVLLARFADDRDQTAFATLVARHGPMVLNVCRRVLGHAHAAEDGFQATFLVLARRAGAVRHFSSLAAWLYGVAYRVALKARRANRRQAGAADLARITAVADPHADPLAELTARELLAVLEHEIQRLPELYRLPVVLCCLDGLTQKEAAERLGWTEGSVKGRLQRGRARLHARLARRGLTLAAAVGVVEAARGYLWARLPPGWMERTVQASAAFAASPTPAHPLLSVNVVELAQGALQETTMLKLKWAMLAALVIGAATLGASTWTPAAADPQQDGAKPLLGQAEPPKPQAGAPAADPLPPGVLARLGGLRFRHEGYANQVLFAAGDQWLVGNTSSGVLVWDAATGKLLRRLTDHHTGHFAQGALDIAPDGTTLVTVEFHWKKPSEVCLWDLRSGKKTRTLAVETGKDAALLERSGPAVRFAPDGKSLAIVHAGEKAIQILDLATGKVTASFGEISSGIAWVTFAPDGKTLATATQDPGLGLWDIATGKMIHGVDDMALAVAFAPNGKIVAWGQRGRIVLHDPASGKALGSFEDKMNFVLALSFTPDGKTLIAACQDGKVRLWDVANKQVRYLLDSRQWPSQALPGDGKPVAIATSSMALSRDGKTLAIGTSSSTVRLWEVATGKERFADHQGHDSWVSCVSFSPDGKTLASGEFNDQICLWETASWKLSRVLKGRAFSLSFSPDGKRLASVPVHDTVHLWDLATAKEQVVKVQGTDYVRAVLFSTDGRKLFTLDKEPNDSGESPWGPHRLRHWDSATLKQEKVWLIPGQMYRPVIAPSGLAVLVGGKDALRLFDAKSGKDRSFPSGGSPELQALAVSPDGRVVASGDIASPHAVRTWELATGKAIFVLKGHEFAVSSVAWSPDGRIVASADNNRNYANPDNRKSANTVRLWDAVTGKELAKFGGLDAVVTSLAFSPDGAYLVGGLQDGTILVFDARPSAAAARLAARPLALAELESSWADLARDEAPPAHQATWALIGAGQQAVPFLAARLKPAAPADAEQIRQWIADLESDKFAVRQAATKALEKVGRLDQAKALIHKALDGKLTLEACQRLEQILQHLPDALDSAMLRVVRAVMVLERIDSPEAREVLQSLARGAPAARETEEALAALDRLARKSRERNKG